MRKKLLFAGGLLSFAMALGMMFGFNVKGNEATPVLATEKVTIVSVGGNPIDHETPDLLVRGDFPMGEINVYYEAQLVAENMNPSGTYKWSISLGHLPDGLTLNEDTGLVSGTPTTIQTGSINVKIENLSDSEDWESVGLGLIIRDPSWQPTITTETLKNAVVGKLYNETVTSTNAGSDESMEFLFESGSLPPGLEVNDLGGSSGRIYGTPTETGTFTFTVKVNCAFGYDTKQYTITVENLMTVTYPVGDYYIGDTIQFNSSIGNSNVNWEITSEHDETTTISNTGLVTIGANETSNYIQVRATSKTNPYNTETSGNVSIIPGVAYSISIIDGVAKKAGNVVNKAEVGASLVLYPDDKSSENLEFKNWTVEDGSASVIIDDPTDYYPEITMPAGNIIIKANYSVYISSVTATFDAPVNGQHVDKTIETGSPYYTGTLVAIWNNKTNNWVSDIDALVYETGRSYGFYIHFEPVGDAQMAPPYSLSGTINGKEADYQGSNLSLYVFIEAVSDAAPQYTVTVTNGTANPTVAEEGTLITITANTPGAAQEFDKWTTSSSGVTFANDKALETTFEMPGNAVEVVATYKAIPQSTVTFNNGGGTGSMSPVNVNQGSEYTLPEPTFTAPANKQFDHWLVGVNKYNPGDKITVNTDTEVTAVYEYIKRTITFDGNGGEGSMANVIVDQGTNYELPANGFTAPLGKRFKNWLIGSSSLNPGQTHTINSDTTIQAVWEDIPVYTVSFNKGAGTGSMTPVEVNDGEKYTLPACGFTAPDNYEFKCWEIGGVQKAVGDKVDITANTEILAVYQNIKRTVSFNAGEGTGTMTSVIVNQGEGYELPASTFTAPANQEFKAWLVGTEEKASGTEINITGDIEITALYKDILHQVTFNKGEGSGSMELVNVKQGSEYTLPNSGFTAPANQEFKAWLVGTEEKAPGSKITITEPITITALYRDIIWTVSFDSNGGTGTMAPVEKVQGQNYTLPANGFTAPDHKQFDHWSVGGVDRAPGYVIEGINSNITVTAVYVYIPHQVTFLAGEGTGSMAPVDVYETQEYTLPANGFTAPTNKEFKCWSVGGENKNPGEVIVIEGDTEITAVYGYNVKTITFNAGEGSGVMAEAKADQGSNYALPACTFTAPANKEFKAWLVGTEEKAVGEEILISDNIEITALYKDIVRTITFNAGEGSGEMSPVNINQGENYTLPANGFTAPANKEFKCWSVGGVEKAPGASITVTGDIVIVANYKDIPAPQGEIVSGGATIKFSDGTSFSGTVTLNVETKKTTTSEAVKSQLKENEEIVAVIDIKLLDGQTEIQPGKAVTISVALPEGVDANSFKIIHIHSEEDVSVVENFTVKDGVVSFEVDKLSEFAFVNVSKGFPGWAVALIVIGSILLLLGIGYCLLFFVFNKYIMQENGKKIRAFVLPWFKKEDEFCVIDMCFRICYRKQEAIYQEK